MTIHTVGSIWKGVDMKHTKGLWETKIEKQRSRIGGEVVKEENGKFLKYPRQRVIGEVFGTDKEGLANARLIAAAPELLAACKFAKGRVRELIGLNLGHEALQKLEQAIKKAEG